MPTCRIFLIEDEPAIAELISLNLHRAGLDVACVVDAAKAQSAVNGVLPSLAVVAAREDLLRLFDFMLECAKTFDDFEAAQFALDAIRAAVD